MHRKNIRITLAIFIIFLYSCSGIFKKNSSTKTSIFDQNNFLYVNQTLFPEYEWTENSRIADSLYVQGLVDYFFNKDYIKALPYFLRAREIYPKDARIYIRIIESYARLNRYTDALKEIERANQEISGFLDIEGIKSYRKELIDAASGKLVSYRKKKGLVGRILGIPGTIWGFFKKLWIF